MNTIDPRAQIGLAAKRPVGADDDASGISDEDVEPFDNLPGMTPTHLGGDRETFGNQPFTLRLSPTRNIPPLLRAWL